MAKRSFAAASEAGTWTQKWRARLEAFGWAQVISKASEYGFRLPRFEAASDEVLADVAGGDEGQRLVIVALRPFRQDVWEAALETMGSRARFAASLLSGKMPYGIESAFDGTGQTLLPSSADDICMTCGCDEPKPCRHQAFILLILGDRFENDPFLFFQLRGMDRTRLLRELKRIRASGSSRTASSLAQESLPVDALPEFTPESFYSALKPVLQLRSTFAPPEPPEAILTRLGPPPFTDPEASRLLVELHRAIGIGAKERLSEWEWRRIMGRGKDKA